MIEIICGSYGHRPNKTTLKLKRPGDPPFSLPEKQEAALIRKGIARRVFSDTPIQQEPDGSPASSDGSPLYDDTMKLAELKEIARIYEVDEAILSPLRSKQEVIAAIDQKLAADDNKTNTGDDGNTSNPEAAPDAPQLSPENPVV